MEQQRIFPINCSSNLDIMLCFTAFDLVQDDTSFQGTVKGLNAKIG